MQLVQIFTSLLLAAFAGYIGAWYFGAIEGNFALLPGRTFVRGFVRNYARLVGLDPESVLAALPAAAAARCRRQSLQLRRLSHPLW